MEYTREQLIQICEMAIVPQDKWNNRDTASAQLGVGKCLVLLKSGCYFEIQRGEGACSTDEETIWIQFWVKDFGFFEGNNDDTKGNKGNWDQVYHYYLPTLKRLNDRIGRDWY